MLTKRKQIQLLKNRNAELTAVIRELQRELEGTEELKEGYRKNRDEFFEKYNEAMDDCRTYKKLLNEIADLLRRVCVKDDEQQDG